MSYAEGESTAEIHLPADIDWHMLDKSKFFILGAALFSGVSGALYPMVVLKTRQQVSSTEISCFKTAYSILKHEGPRGFYRGLGTSLMGTIPARALYMTALELTKSKIGSATVKLGFSEPTAATIANAAAGLSAATAAQLVWTPIDVVSQRLMVQGCNKTKQYKGGIDAFRTILYTDGLRGLYRGYGISTLTYAPSNAVWWGSYSLAHRLIWNGVGCYYSKNGDCGETRGSGGNVFRPDCKAIVAVQGLSAVMASGISALVTMPLDTIKTRMQVLEGEGDRGVLQTMRKLVKEGGISACYRGLGPRWASMSMSATIMITTYEFLKRLSTKDQPQQSYN